MKGLGWAVAATVALLLAPQANASRSGDWIAEQLRGGKEVDLAGETIEGPVDLRGADVLARVFRCESCRFAGRILARDVVFGRAVDLSGSTFLARVDFRGARFDGPALFRSLHEATECVDEHGRATFHEPADFSLAVFDDFTSFAGAKFDGDAVFQDTRFADATLTRVCFQDASFDGASFRGGALFGDSYFRGAASFRASDFRRHTDFARAQFRNGAVFASARFADGASFLVTDFAAEKTQEAATFHSVASVGDLDFSFATFEGAIATFSNLVASGSLILVDASFDEEGGIAMHQVHVRNLDLEVDDVQYIAEAEREDVLEAVEASAKARGDLSTANDAHYELQVLRSRRYATVWRAADYVGYRTVAGYLVRPEHPLGILLLLVTFAAVWRVATGRPTETTAEPNPTSARPRRPGPTTVATARPVRATPEPSKPRSRPLRAASRTKHGLTDYCNCWLDTVSLAVPRRGGAGAVTLSRRVEANVYRVLLVCALVGLASTNPTLREMVDTLL
jgi:uncharacterized protein YjbI with pentapeptide repeats